MIEPEYRLIFPSIWIAKEIQNAPIPTIYFLDYLRFKRGDVYDISSKEHYHELFYPEEKSFNLDHPFIEDLLDFMFRREKFIPKEADILYNIHLTDMRTLDKYFDEHDIRRLIDNIKQQQRERIESYNFFIDANVKHKEENFPVLVGKLILLVERIDLI